MKIYDILNESSQQAYHITDIFSSRIEVYGNKVIRNLNLANKLISTGKLTHQQEFSIKMWATAQVSTFDGMLLENSKLLTITSNENATNIQNQLSLVRNEIELLINKIT